MAVTQTVTVVRRGVEGDRKFVDATLAFTGTYVTNGQSLTASDFGLTTLEGVQIFGGVGDGIWDHTANKLRLYVAATGAEVANTADPSGVQLKVRAIGT